MPGHTETPEVARQSLSAALAIASNAIALLLLVFMMISRLYYKELHVTRDFEFNKLAILALASALLSLGLLRRVLDFRVMLAVFSALTTASLGLVGCLVLSIDVAESVKQIVFRERDPDIFVQDERYGYRLRPSSRGIEKTRDWTVTYSIDETGHRTTPSPKQPRGTVLIAGDSFAFGTGVEDHETFPYLLGNRYWPEFKVVNAGVAGWGLTQAYLSVLDALAPPSQPKLIVYEMIPDDQFRSYLRLPVTKGVTRRLEFVHGELVSRDVAGRQTPPTITPELAEQELQLNLTLLLKMNQSCREKNVGFAVVLMQDEGRFPPDLIYRLGASAIPMVDLTRLRYERFGHDYHPNPADHRRIAEAISNSVATPMLHGQTAASAR